MAHLQRQIKLVENSLKKTDSDSKDIETKPEDNTRYGDWVKNGRTIDF